jgi:repressor LexA
MSQKPPTQHQVKVLREIAAFTVRWGYPPTIRELCDTFAVSSTNAMAEVVAYLIDKGLLRRRSKLARSLTLTDEGKTFI